MCLLLPHLVFQLWGKMWLSGALDQVFTAYVLTLLPFLLLLLLVIGNMPFYANRNLTRLVIGALFLFWLLVISRLFFYETVVARVYSSCSYNCGKFSLTGNRTLIRLMHYTWPMSRIPFTHARLTLN